MKFGWLSDTHLGYMQYGLERRKTDFAFALKDAVGQMLRRDIRVIIHSGDLLHSNRPSPDVIYDLKTINKMLIEAGAAMYVVSGNHDRTVPHWIETLENTFPRLGIQLMDFRAVGYPDGDGFVNFYGVPYMAPEQFKRFAFPDGDVLVMHQMLQEFVGYQSPEMLSAVNMPKSYKLIAIGDVHVNQQLRISDNTWIGYPGSTELYSESEDAVKYWMECTLDESKRLSMTRVPINTRKVIRIDIWSDESGELEKTIAQVNGMWEKSLAANPNEREPILIITFLNSVEGVMQKFQAAFNPDKFILRWKPVYNEVLIQKALSCGIAEQDEMSISDILRSQLASKPGLFGIASQLINPEIDGNAALNEFIEGRIRSAEAAKPA
jgi:DNA repair exonuclease SbcCD nuclease subunit